MGRDVQIFKYKIKNEFYYILTSITEHISVNEIKAIYWKRWKLESNNKKFKYDVLCTDIRSKNYNSLMVDIESVRFMLILSGFIEYLGSIDLSSKRKINSR